MRRWLASGSVLGVVAFVAACGGKVAVENGGTGGTTSSSSSSGTVTTSGGCAGVQCKEFEDNCTCFGTCDAQDLEVDCMNGTCTCLENGIKIFNCAATGAS